MDKEQRQSVYADIFETVIEPHLRDLGVLTNQLEGSSEFRDRIIGNDMRTILDSLLTSLDCKALEIEKSKPEIYVDATNLPFFKVAQWARTQGYTCVNDNGRVHFEKMDKANV
jgi:hypothetical protein